MNKINVLRAKYTGANIVHELNRYIGTSKDISSEFLENPEAYNKNRVSILVYDYTPVVQGNILIKEVSGTWEKLRLNSKIFKALKNKVVLKESHISKRSNWISSIRRSNLNFIEID